MPGKLTSVKASIQDCLHKLNESNRSLEAACTQMKDETVDLGKALPQVQATVPEGYQSTFELSQHAAAIEGLWTSLSRSQRSTERIQQELEESKRNVSAAILGLVDALQKQYRE